VAVKNHNATRVREHRESGKIRRMDAPEGLVAETNDEHGPAELPSDDSGAAAVSPQVAADNSKPREIGGPRGAEPTRYGDWERAGRCIDF
jgi:hypothetical protein